MGYFDSEENVESYIDMVEGCDGAALVEILTRHLPGGSSVLEIGMGPGKDQLLLSRHYSATGSDSSVVFVDRYKAQQPDADVIVLDAVDLNTRRQFDAIYSNKVLQHLPKMSAALSIEAQHRVLKPGGIVLHSLWYGDGADEHHGLLFQKYTVETFSQLVEGYFDVVESGLYKELEANDSLYVVLSRRSPPHN